MFEKAAQRRPVRVAVVDDSSFIRKALERILSGDPRLEVVGTADCGEKLLDHLDDWRPDVITLDIAMPGMGGLATLDQIRVRRPTPVLVLSTHTGHEAPLTIEALHRGALDFINKQSYSLVDFQSLGAVLIDKVLHLSATGRRPAAAGPAIDKATDDAGTPAASAEVEKEPPPAGFKSRFRAILLGASTGGPVAIQRVLEDLGTEVPVPIVIVQHMPKGFTGHFAERLNAHLPFAVREALDGEPLMRGTAYVASAGRHLEIIAHNNRLEARLAERSSHTPHCPSIDRLFSSAAEAIGSAVVAALLTGMGRDGAEGLSQLAKLGAHTMAQDEATSVVYGMPRAANDLQAAREVLPLEKIGPRTRRLVTL